MLEIEKEIENIIENKIFKKTEKIKEKELTKYAVFASFYTKNKEHFREKDPKSKASIIKEINSPDIYKEEEYPYYKSFLYSDYPDEAFLKARLKELDKDKYPVIDLYLNRENMKKGINKEFIRFNFVIKSLLNECSNKMSRIAAKKLTLEKTFVYKQNEKICDAFIKIIKSKNGEISKESSLENFLIDRSSKVGKLYIDMYERYAESQNNLLNEIIEKINISNYDTFECQEINIQDAQRGDLLILEFENKSEFTEILLSNTFREIYNANFKIKYNNYNLFSIDFEKIEKILEDTLIRNACILKTDEIAEMKYSGEEFLNDGISDLNTSVKPTNLDEKDKTVFVDFYEKKLKTNLDSCLEVNEGLKNIIAYINKNIKKINNSKGVNTIITEGGFTYELNNDLKSFLKDNTNIIISKLTNLTIYLEKLYFELAIDRKGGEYKVKLDDSTKEKIQKYYEDKTGQLITKDKLSITIIRFILNDLMNQNNDKAKNRLFESDDNLFDILANKFLWEKSVVEDSKFAGEIEEYKKLGIYVKNTYDFYMYIAVESINKFENEVKEILGKIKVKKNQKSKTKKKKKEKKKKKKSKKQKLTKKMKVLN